METDARIEAINKVREACGQRSCENPKYTHDPFCCQCRKLDLKSFDDATAGQLVSLLKTLRVPGENDFRVQALDNYCTTVNNCDSCKVNCNEDGDLMFMEMDELKIEQLYAKLLGVQGKDDEPYEPVKSPSHYTVGGIEVIDYIKAKLTPEEFKGYCKGNVLKYLSRAGHKDDELQEYRKAQMHMDWMVADAAAQR